MTSAVRRSASRACAALVLMGAACARAPETNAGDTAAADSAAPPPASVGATAAAPDTASQPVTPPARDSGRTAGGAGGPPAPTPRPTPSEDVMVGEVVAGGLADAPVTSLRVEGRGPVTLVGPMEVELRRLGGATVTVAGGPAAGAPNASFSVSRYDIVSIDGARPAVGTLVTRSGTLWLAGSDTARLASVPAALQTRAGAKVWIVGRRSGSELTVQSYGIIREP